MTRKKKQRSFEGSNEIAGQEDLKPQTLLADQPKDKKLRSFIIRFISTWTLIGAFAGIIYAGHIYVCCLIFVVHVMMFKEIIRIGSVWEREQKVHTNRYLNWHFFFTTVLFVYGRALKPQIGNELLARGDFWGRSFITLVMKYHTMFSFLAYMTGVMLFVASLRKKMYNYQFGQFAWTHMTLMMVVVQSTFLLSNMYEGLIWFLLPVFLVITNDVQAYMFGMVFGRTPLIKLSPKKTWEGFIGGFFSTVVMAFLLGRFLSQYEYLICPKKTLFSGDVSCEVNAIFLDTTYHLPEQLILFLSNMGFDGIATVTFAPIQVHSAVMSIFASLVAPFGGFFASGFKRAFKIKDFGDTIPGHGGITDRMDCQLSMGLFAYIYITSFVLKQTPDLKNIMSQVVKLSVKDQLQVYQTLQAALGASGALK